MSAVQFKARPPLPGGAIMANVRDATRRGLSWATDWPRDLTIIANGPTALHADLDAPVLAVNGAINLFGEVGPTYWVAFDPQEGVADLLPADPPKNTIYFVASQCHPAVFDKLKGRDVRLWHVEHPDEQFRDAVPSAVSVTLMAMQLMARLGYRRFETWGWDGCYLDGRDHAAPQARDPSLVEDIRIRVGDEVFETTTSWAAEAQDACALLALADFKVTIHGGGMIGAIVKARVRR